MTTRLVMAVAMLIALSGEALAMGKDDTKTPNTCGWTNGQEGTNGGVSVCCPAGKVATSWGCTDGSDQTPATPGADGWNTPDNPGTQPGGGGGAGDCRYACVTEMNECKAAADDFGDLCLAETLGFARDECEEGIAITTASGGGAPVRPAGWQWVWSGTENLPNPDTCDTPGAKLDTGADHIWVCELHWIDPDQCLLGWMYGKPGQGTTTGGQISVEVEGYGGSTYREVSLSVNPQDGMIKACQAAKLAEKTICAKEKVKCTRGCR